jgi:uncharacterized protein (TIGR03066 family)
MSALRLLVASLLVLGMSVGLMAEEKKAEVTKEKLIGAWEAVKVDEKTLPVGSVVTLMKDGKMTLLANEEGNKQELKGTWTVSGNKVTANLMVEDREIKHEVTVTKLTDTELIMTNDQGKAVEFKKKKQ